LVSGFSIVSIRQGGSEMARLFFSEKWPSEMTQKRIDENAKMRKNVSIYIQKSK